MTAGFRQRSVRGVGRAEREEIEGEVKPCRVPPRKTALAVAKAQADAALAPKYEDPRAKHLISVAPSALADLRGLLDKERLRARLGKDSGRPVKADSEDRSCESIAESRNPGAAAEAKMGKMLLWLEKGKPLHAVQGLDAVARAYLIDGRRRIPAEVGEEALRCIEIIGRAWAVAAASEYVRLPLSDYLPYFKGARFFDGEGEISWPYWAIKMLGMAGKPSDLETIKIVARGIGEYSAQKQATQSSNFIMIMAALRTGLGHLDAERREELGLADLRMADGQLVHVLKHLFNGLGIARALSMLPSMRRYGDCVYDRYLGSTPEYDRDHEKWELVKLLKDGLSREIDGMSELDWEIKEIRELLVDYAFIRQPEGEWKYFLTEKGKELVRAIMAEVIKAETGAGGIESGAGLALLGE